MLTLYAACDLCQADARPDWDASGVGVMSAATAAAIASSYDLGVLAGDPVYAARGEQGRIWRLDTCSGSWAVKELLLPVGRPRPPGTFSSSWPPGLPGYRCRCRGARVTGRVVLPAEEASSAWSVRVYRWADIAHGQAVTAAEIGAVTARLHQVSHADPGPIEA